MGFCYSSLNGLTYAVSLHEGEARDMGSALKEITVYMEWWEIIAKSIVNEVLNWESIGCNYQQRREEYHPGHFRDAQLGLWH